MLIVSPCAVVGIAMNTWWNSVSPFEPTLPVVTFSLIAMNALTFERSTYDMKSAMMLIVLPSTENEPLMSENAGMLHSLLNAVCCTACAPMFVPLNTTFGTAFTA